MSLQKKKEKQARKRKLIEKRKQEKKIQEAVAAATKDRKAKAEELTKLLKTQHQSKSVPPAECPKQEITEDKPVSHKWVHESFVPNDTILDIQWTMVDDDGEKSVENFSAVYKGLCDPPEFHAFVDDEGCQEPIEVPVTHVLYEYDDHTQDINKVCFLTDCMVYDLEYDCVLVYKQDCDNSKLISLSIDATEESVREIVRPIIESTFLQFIEAHGTDIDKHDMDVQLMITDKLSHMREIVTEGLIEYMMEHKGSVITETELLNNMLNKINSIMDDNV